MAQRAADVIIVGGGAMGAGAAWRLARAGFRVQLFEQFGVGHELGSSHGPSRMIRLAYEKPEYVELGRAAYQFWRDLEAESGESLLRVTGGLDIGTPDAYHLPEVEETFTALGMPFEKLDRAQLEARFPELNLPEGTIGIYSPDYGILSAGTCVVTMIQQAERAGAEIHANERVLEVRPDAEGVTVRTDTGEYRARSVILTAGSWTNPLLASLGVELPLTVLQEQLAFFAVADPAAHEPGTMPLIIHRYPGTTTIGSYFPIHDHTGIKMMIDRVGPEVDPASEERGIDPARLEELRAYATSMIRGCTGEVLETTSCRYTMTPDEDFIIDLHPAHANVVIASCCSGHAFKFAPVVGQILADLALTGETDYPTELFRMDRPALQQKWSREVLVEA
ncbi:MAG: N-methyl-L-tryptophan oxidase [Thermomicrobiales bacterium]|nr:N-methyl-L-tryptophan oxidase [Thermomicrobiales bacterium]